MLWKLWYSVRDPNYGIQTLPHKSNSPSSTSYANSENPSLGKKYIKALKRFTFCVKLTYSIFSF